MHVNDDSIANLPLGGRAPVCVTIVPDACGTRRYEETFGVVLPLLRRRGGSSNS